MTCVGAGARLPGRDREVHTDVLVVGAGPAGLTTAITLARAGADVLVVERHNGTSPFPKATGINTRTMELLRGWGLDQRVRAGGMRVRPAVTSSETLIGPELASSATTFPSEQQALAVSPTAPSFCAQDHLEPILLAHLVAHGGRDRFNTELTDLRLTPAGVIAEVVDRESGRQTRVHARYVVGADGPRSTVRSLLGIDVQDLGTLGEFVAVTFRADLAARMPRIPSVINVVERVGAEGLFVPTSNDGRWIYAHPADDRTRDYPEVLRTVTGVADLDPHILTVMRFVMGAQVATTLRRGPAFLVGDAAHRTTPMGGIGMNTAIQAAHNLGWKLAWVLRGHAGEALLDSYQAERLPVGRANALRSLETEAPVGTEYDPLAIDLGVAYSSAVIARAPGAVALETTSTGSDSLMRAVTGRRAPHAWILKGGRRVSTLDLFEDRLTLMSGYDGARWQAAADALATHGLPITALAAGSDFHPVDRSFEERYRLGSADAVLVRPDGYLVHRLAGSDGDTPAMLRAAVELALGANTGTASLVRAG